MPNSPPTIFRYEPFTAQGLLNLKSNAVYFASPLQFNDPYDCAITASFSEMTDEELEMVKNSSHFVGTGIPTEAQLQLRMTPKGELKQMLSRVLEKVVVDQKESFLKTNGICCFTERNNDLLMWSHYGGRCKGWCLEFRTDQEPFNKLRKVKYVDSMPVIRAGHLIDDRGLEQILDLFCTKSKSWEYEQEWRAIHRNAGTLFSYKSEALKAIYFGPDIERQALEIVCLILAGQNPDVELWKGTRSASRFEVEFEKFTYTSHIEAKRKGLL